MKIDEKAKDYKMSCQFVGSKVPLDNPWIQGSHLLTMDPEKVVASREPPNALEGFVQWTRHFLKVSKSSTLFGNYSCALKNARSKTASLLLAGESHTEKGILYIVVLKAYYNLCMYVHTAHIMYLRIHTIHAVRLYMHRRIFVFSEQLCVRTQPVKEGY